MGFLSAQFFGLLLLSYFTYSLARRTRFRNIALLAINACFLGLFVGSVKEAEPLLIFALIGYLLILLNRKFPRGSVLKFSISLLVILFLIVKRYTIVPHPLLIRMTYTTVGMSYILFRVIHLVHEEGQDPQGKNRVSGLGYVQYLFSFLTFLSGPIQRYGDFATQSLGSAAPPDLTPEEILYSLGRVVNGYFKAYVVATVFESLQHQFLGFQNVSRIWMVLFSAGALSSYTCYLYFNFAGYMDIVIGIGRFFDFSLPENFDHPLRSASLIEFWGRWHITLSEWFRDYVFNPLATTLGRTFRAKRFLAYVVVMAYFGTFLAMGIWHGSTQMFFIYGLFLGLGTSLNKLYQLKARQKLGKQKQERLNAHPLYRALCQGMTFSYFSISLTCVWLPLSEWKLLFSKLGALGAFGAFGLIAILYALAILGASAAKALIKPGWEVLHGLENSFVARNLSMACKVYVIVVSIVMQGKDLPEFVYKAF